MYLSRCMSLDQSIDGSAECFADSFQVTAQDIANDLGELLSSRMTKFCWDYLRLISAQKSALRRKVTVLRILVGFLVEAVTGLADTSLHFSQILLCNTRRGLD